MPFVTRAPKDGIPPHSPELVSQRATVAQATYERFDFGEGAAEEYEDNRGNGEFFDAELKRLFETEPRDWRHSATGDVWMRPVFMLTTSGDVSMWFRLEFSVEFSRFSDQVVEAYAIDKAGSLRGSLPDATGRLTQFEDSLLRGPWRWREITSDDRTTVALALETQARPRRDPIIIQALLDNRSLPLRDHDAAREMMRLAPDMLDLLARIVQSSSGPTEELAKHIKEAERMLKNLTFRHHEVDFRVPGFWSAEE